MSEQGTKTTAEQERKARITLLMLDEGITLAEASERIDQEEEIEDAELVGQPLTSMAPEDPPTLGPDDWKDSQAYPIIAPKNPKSKPKQLPPAQSLTPPEETTASPEDSQEDPTENPQEDPEDERPAEPAKDFSGDEPSDDDDSFVLTSERKEQLMGFIPRQLPQDLAAYIATAWVKCLQELQSRGLFPEKIPVSFQATIDPFGALSMIPFSLPDGVIVVNPNAPPQQRVMVQQSQAQPQAQPAQGRHPARRKLTVGQGGTRIG